MARRGYDGPWLYSDDGKQIVGIRHPDDTESPWGGGASVPPAGWPRSQLAADVQASLGTPTMLSSMPDPRQPAGVSAQVVYPGATSQHVATSIGGRIIVAGHASTNANAGISVTSSSGRKVDAIQGATDAVNLRWADLDRARQPIFVATGSAALAAVIEVI